MNSTGKNSNLKYLTQIQELADSIERVWGSVSPVVRKNKVLNLKYAKIKALKQRLQLKIQGEIKDENTK